MRTSLGVVTMLLAASVGCAVPPAHAQPRNAAPPAVQSRPTAAPRAKSAPTPGPSLTPEQRDRIQALRDATWDEIRPFQRDLMAKRAELQALWAAPEPNRDAILKKQSEMDGLRQKIRAARVEEHLAILKLLTPEQRAAMPPGGAGPGWGSRAGGCLAGTWGPGPSRGRGRGRGMGWRGGW